MKSRIVLGIVTFGLLLACVSLPANIIATQAPTDTPEPTNTATPVPPTATPTIDPATLVSFEKDVFPILQNHCINCHGGQRIEEGLVMKSYASLMAGSDNGPVIFPGDAANSLLIELIATQKMPKKGPKLSRAQIQLIVDWVNQGAMDN